MLPDDGVPRLYSMRFCPFAQRAHLALNAKKVPHHTIYINLKEKPEWYAEFSPLLKVPALQLVAEKDQPSLIESLIIAEYVDEKYPENPLLPKDPVEKAQAKILVERFSPVAGAFMKVMLHGANGDEIWPVLDIFEQELAKRGTSYFGGDKPGWVDYMIWPWFERINALPVFLKEQGFSFDKQRFAKISDWIELLIKDEVVQSHYATPEQHSAFFNSLKTGAGNYDLLA